MLKRDLEWHGRLVLVGATQGSEMGGRNAAESACWCRFWCYRTKTWHQQAALPGAYRPATSCAGNKLLLQMSGGGDSSTTSTTNSSSSSTTTTTTAGCSATTPHSAASTASHGVAPTAPHCAAPTRPHSTDPTAQRSADRTARRSADCTARHRHDCTAQRTTTRRVRSVHRARYERREHHRPEGQRAAWRRAAPSAASGICRRGNTQRHHSATATQPRDRLDPSDPLTLEF